MTDEQTTATRWQTFTGWHRTEQLWREVYTRTMSALAAALVIYLVAAVSGLVSRKPLPWLALIGAAMVFWPLVRTIRGMRRGGRHPRVSELVAFAGAGWLLVGYAIQAWANG